MYDGHSMESVSVHYVQYAQYAHVLFTTHTLLYSMYNMYCKYSMYVVRSMHSAGTEYRIPNALYRAACTVLRLYVPYVPNKC